MCHGCWRETSKRERGKEKEEERARERERDRNDRRDRERRDRERERKDRDRKFVNLRTPKKTNANPSCVSPATRPVGSRHGVRAKISDFCAKPGFSPFPRYQKFGACGQCVVSHLKLANNDSCRTLKKKKHTRCQYNTKKNVIHRV